MIKRKADYFKFEEDILKLDNYIEFKIKGELLFFKDCNEIKIINEVEVMFNYIHKDEWQREHLTDKDLNKFIDYLWDFEFDIEQEELKNNLKDFANKLLEDIYDEE